MIEITNVRSSEQIGTVARLADTIWREHYVPIIGGAQVDYMLKRFQSIQAITEQVEHGHNYLLATLDSGDSIAIARIDSGSFSEKDIIAKVTFDDRPSTANQQKRMFKDKIDEFVNNTKRGSRHTDITGGMLQASEYLDETGAGERYVLIFSDLEEDLQKGHIRDFPISLPDIHVVALNVTKLRSDNIDPRDYNAVIVWCETFGQFITAAKYQ